MGGTVLGWTETLKLGRPKRRNYRTISGVGFGLDYGVHNDSYNNLRRGLLERVLFRVEHGKSNPTPEPEAEFYREELSSVREAIVAHTRVCRRMTRSQFVECYTGRKRLVYERAVESLRTRPLNKSDSYLSTFVKSEKICFSRKPDPAPRVIQPRSPRYNVEVGRSLKRMEMALKMGIAEVWGGPTIMKGYNASDTGAAFKAIWAGFRHPVAIPVDAVRFDQHVSRDALEYEHSVYLACVPESDRKRLAALLKWQLVNKGFARTDEGDITYEVEGRRMSGDMNTGMGNCLLMCSLFLAFFRSLGVVGRLANNGDDCTLFIEESDLEAVQRALPSYFRRAGFVLTVEEPCYALEDIEFCQTRPVEVTPGEYVMVRDPRVAIDKDLCTQIDVRTPGAFGAWAQAIGHCELALGSGVPLWQAFASMLLRVPGPKRELELIRSSGMSFLANGMGGGVKPIHDVCRASFYRAFRFTPDMQAVIEGHFDSCQLTTLAIDVGLSPIACFINII